MTKNEKDLLDMLVQQRISFYYERMENCSEEESFRRNKLDRSFEKIIEQLPKEQAAIIREHENVLLCIGGEQEHEAYLGGVRDGMKLQEELKKFLERS